MQTTQYAIVGDGVLGAILALIMPKKSVLIVPEKAPTANNKAAHFWIAISEANLNFISELLAMQTSDLYTQIKATKVTNMMLFFGAEELHIANHTSERISYIVAQDLLQKLIMQVTKKNCQLIASKFLYSNITQDKVQITLADNTQIQADILLAADGSDSRVRMTNDINVAHYDCCHKALVAEIEFADTQKTNTAWQLFGRHIIGLLPINEECTRACLIWSTPADAAQYILASTEQEQHELLNRITSLALPPIKLLTKLRAFKLRQFLAKNIQPPIICMGNAAHTIHPLAGQGLNLALQDIRYWQSAYTKATSPHAVARLYCKSARHYSTLIAEAVYSLYRYTQAPSPTRNLINKLVPLAKRFL